MMILIVAIQIIPELSNSVSFTILRKSSIRREKKKITLQRITKRQISSRLFFGLCTGITEMFKSFYFH